MTADDAVHDLTRHQAGSARVLQQVRTSFLRTSAHTLAAIRRFLSVEFRSLLPPEPRTLELHTALHARISNLSLRGPPLTAQAIRITELRQLVLDRCILTLLVCIERKNFQRLRELLLHQVGEIDVGPKNPQ